MTKTKEELNGLFPNGSMNVRIESLPYERNEYVKLEVEEDLLPYVEPVVYLLSPYMHQSRQIAYMAVDELIRMFPEVREELDPSLGSVVETLLLALDYLTNPSFFDGTFSDEQKDTFFRILETCFEERKGLSFSSDDYRPNMHKETVYVSEGKLHCEDNREKKIRIYMAVLFKKSTSRMEHFRHVGIMLQQLQLKPNKSSVSYEEMLAGKTDIELHENCLYFLNMVLYTLSWVLNSASWRGNNLFPFDEIDIRCKLGLR